MIHRERLKPPDYVYPADPWRMVEKRFYRRLLGQTETFMALANGYLGMRGTPEEGRPVAEAGTFVNGFYESWPIVYGESAYGFAKTGQTLVEVPDGTIIRLYVDDEPLYLPTAELVEYERALDMRTGTLDRTLVWQTPARKLVEVRSRRLVSLEHRHVAAIDYTVTVRNAAAPVAICSELVYRQPRREQSADPRQTRAFAERILEPRLSEARDGRLVLGHTTRNSKMTLVTGVDHLFETECPHRVERRHGEDDGEITFTVDAQPGAPIHLTKFLVYHSSRGRPPQELHGRAERTLDRTVRLGFSHLLETQQSRLDEFWGRADISLEHDVENQQAVRFNLFQLHQATARAEGAGVPAKGLTGHGYEGHYFWDTEIYVLPFLIYTWPGIAENLLRFRCGFLDDARRRARQMSQKGALFPWRTINGEEASAYYAAGTAQAHIDADIAYAIRKYVQVTGDEDFLEEVGAEVLVETARFWEDLGFYSERRDGRFCIHGVTGPDEYNTVVDNNAFTNLMARANLSYAAEVVQTLRDEKPERFAELADKTELQVEEIAAWKRAAERMYVPFDEKLGINPQDDQFLDREPWDLEGTPPEKYPLLLHHHPLVIYRHQVIKQADIVLAMFLLGNEFSHEQKKRNFDYYDPITTGDSSLSVCVQAIMAEELGYRERAREYMRFALMMDLEDIHSNVQDGLHIASMGGTWMAVVYGLAGMRDYDGHLSFHPHPLFAPDGRLSFPLTVRDARLRVTLAEGQIHYALEAGPELTLTHVDEEIRLTPDSPTATRPCLRWTTA